MANAREIERLPFHDQLTAYIQSIDDAYPLELAYLFGSYAKGTGHRESDIDVALLFKQTYTQAEELLLLGRLMDEGAKRLDRKVDIVFLHRASPLLRYEVVRHRIVLKDSPQRASFESLAIREYFDFRYYAEIYNQAVLQRIAGGAGFER